MMMVDTARIQAALTSCAAMSLGLSRNRPLAHSSAGPGACNGRLPHHEWIGGPLPTFGELNLANTDSEIGIPFAFKNETSCRLVISGRPSAGACVDCLARVSRLFSVSDNPVDGILIWCPFSFPEVVGHLYERRNECLDGQNHDCFNYFCPLCRLRPRPLRARVSSRIMVSREYRRPY